MKIVVIDSLSGYLNAMPEQRQLMVQLHELLSYLNGAGVLTLLVVATQGFTGHNEEDVNASYIADTVVMMRSFEAGGRIRRCISVLKKRHGDHEKTIREIRIDQNGVRVGAPQGSVFTLVMPLNDSGPGADSSALKMNSVLSPESEAVHATIPPVLRVALVD